MADNTSIDDDAFKFNAADDDFLDCWLRTVLSVCCLNGILRFSVSLAGGFGTFTYTLPHAFIYIHILTVIISIMFWLLQVPLLLILFQSV